MKSNPINTGIISENFAGVGTVTAEMVAVRAGELALIDGRHIGNPSPTDYEQATRELTGRSEIDPRDEVLESMTEAEGEDLTPADRGVQTEESSGEDEDSEGAQMFLQGMNEADHDRRLQAARELKKEDDSK